MAGNPMNQNANGTNGEVPGDRFTAAVTVDPPDTAGPRVIAASPSGTIGGPFDRFTLTFDEAIDAATFTLADVVSLTGPGGAIPPLAVASLNATQFEVTFAPQSATGGYSLAIGPDIRDTAGNAMNQNGNGENGEVPGDRFAAGVTVSPADTSGPRVTASSPGGTIPGPFDRFTLTFDEPVDVATFTLDDVVSLTGPAGAIAPTAVASSSSTQFEVHFAPQTGAGTYTLLVGPDIRDGAGNQMNQNQNGINGEPGDQFMASVTVDPPDTAGPRVTAASPSGTTPGPVDRFTLTFNEAIDTPTFTIADVASLSGPGGALMPVAVAMITSTQFDVTFAPQQASGTYTIVVGPDIRDAAGNQMDQNANGVKGEVPGDRFSASVVVSAPVCDADGDQDVDLADLQAIRAAFGIAAAAGDPRDGNGDGAINIADLRSCRAKMTTTP
jgi:methionine-rich copper-binding protein CopC